MFERFAADARAAVVQAREEASRAGRREIGSDHLVLGLLGTDGAAGDVLAAAGLDCDRLGAGLGGGSDPLDAGALASLGIDLDAVRRAADAAFGRDALDRAARTRRSGRGRGRMVMTAEAKQVLERGLRVAVSRRDGHLTGAHLLLGVLDLPGSQGALALTAAGTDLSRLRTDLTARLARAA